MSPETRHEPESALESALREFADPAAHARMMSLIYNAEFAINGLRLKTAPLRNQEGRASQARKRAGAPALVAPSYNHTSEERAFTACAGAACFLGAILIVVVALVLSWWRG